MRRIDLALGLLAAAIPCTFTACRQAPATTASGPLVPLSPNNPSSTPSLMPFGGQTRVTPPTTGSYSVPNNYLGAATIGRYGTPQANAFAGPTTATGSQVIGSGVQQASWTNNTSYSAQTLTPTASRQATNPQAGGMRTIDLTGAPPPPGYSVPLMPQPSLAASQPAFGQPGTPIGQPGTLQSATMQPRLNPTPLQPIPAPNQVNFSAAPAPLVGVAQVPQFQPRSPAPQTSNLTPIATPTTGQPPANTHNNLPWRTPGAQF